MSTHAEREYSQMTKEEKLRALYGDNIPVEEPAPAPIEESSDGDFFDDLSDAEDGAGGDDDDFFGDLDDADENKKRKKKKKQRGPPTAPRPTKPVNKPVSKVSEAFLSWPQL